MTFDYPFVLIAFIIYVPLVIFDIFASSKNKKYKLPEKLERKINSSVFLFRIFIACVIIAIACPRWGTGFAVSEYRRGLDAVFAIDVSRSMDIRDAFNSGSKSQELSRLERGLSIAKESMASVAGIRYAAAIGRSRGLLALPLTWESESILSFLEALDGSSMTGRSTNLESLIDAAASAFQNSSPAQKIIILLSDGESHSGAIKNALDRCVKEGIIVNTIALGSDEGRQLSAEASFEKASFAEADSDVISRREAFVMRMAAERTGGIYIDGSNSNAAGILASHLLSLVRDTASGSRRPEPKEKRTLFIILAIIFYTASKFAPLFPGKKIPPGISRASIAVMVLLLTSCSQSNSFVQSKFLLIEANYLYSRGKYDEAIIPYLKALNYKEAAPYAEYGLGLSFYMLDEGNAALKRYENSQKMLEAFSASEHSELRYRNSYNSGIVFFGEGNFSAAADAFKDALRANPGKIESKRNLELSLLSIANETASQNASKEQQENKTRDILFDYIRQKEQQQWKSGEWIPEEKFEGPDY